MIVKQEYSLHAWLQRRERERPTSTIASCDIKFLGLSFVYPLKRQQMWSAHMQHTNKHKRGFLLRT